MHPDQRKTGPRHRSGRRELWTLPPTYPFNFSVRAHHVDRPLGGELPHRRERVHLRAVRVQRGFEQRAVEAKILFEQRQQQQDATGQQEVFVDLVVNVVVVDDHHQHNAQQPKESSADDQRGIINSGRCRGLQRLDQENGLPLGSEKVVFNRTVGCLRLQLDWTSPSNLKKPLRRTSRREGRGVKHFFISEKKDFRFLIVGFCFVSKMTSLGLEAKSDGRTSVHQEEAQDY